MKKTIHILLVEDDDVDAEAVERAFRKHRIANPITRAVDGVEALEILRGDLLSRPYLILLDLNLPRMDGLEFLREMRRDPRLKGSIVFVLSTSDDDRDKLAAYDSNIAGYLVKTKVDGDFHQLVEILEPFWRYIEFPPEKSP